LNKHNTQTRLNRGEWLEMDDAKGTNYI
jgi:hypothetical protein